MKKKERRELLLLILQVMQELNPAVVPNDYAQRMLELRRRGEELLFPNWKTANVKAYADRIAVLKDTALPYTLRVKEAPQTYIDTVHGVERAWGGAAPKFTAVVKKTPAKKAKKVKK